MTEEQIYNKYIKLVKNITYKYSNIFTDLEELESIANYNFAIAIMKCDKNKEDYEIAKFIENSIKWGINYEIRKTKTKMRDFKKREYIDNSILENYKSKYDEYCFDEEDLKKILYKIMKKEMAELFFDYVMFDVNNNSDNSRKKYNEMLMIKYNFKNSYSLAQSIYRIKNKILNSNFKDELYCYLTT